MDKLKSLLRGVANSATLGFGDEIVGGINALKDVATTDKTLADTPELYEQYRDRYRANSKLAQEANPKTYAAGELAGGLATIAMPGSAIRAPSLAKAIMSGSGYGAAMGLGTGEGDAQEQALNALKGAGAGAALAPVAYGAGKSFDALKGILGRNAPSSPVIPPGRIGSELEEVVQGLKYAKGDASDVARRISPDDVFERIDKAAIPGAKARNATLNQALQDEAASRAARAGLVNDELTQPIVQDNIDELTKALMSKFGGK